MVAALAGGAGAGGAVLALAADEVWARPGVVLNPHYRGWAGCTARSTGPTCCRGGWAGARARGLTEGLLPVGAGAAAAMGLIDAAFGAGGGPPSWGEVAARAEALAAGGDYAARLAAKAARRRRDEAAKPLAAYRAEELAHMHRSFYGPDPAFHEARRRFVHKLPPDGPRYRAPAEGPFGVDRRRMTGSVRVKLAPGAGHSRVDSRPARGIQHRQERHGFPPRSTLRHHVPQHHQHARLRRWTKDVRAEGRAPSG